MRQWLVAGVGSHFQVESAFTLQRHRVQIIQTFCLLVKIKETKPNRGRTSLLPERWCNQHGMLIDCPDNRAAQKGSLGASGPAGQCPHLWDLMTLISGAAEGLAVTAEPGRLWKTPTSCFQGKYLRGRAQHQIMQWGLQGALLHNCCWGTTVKNHAIFTKKKKKNESDFYFSWEKKQHINCCEQQSKHLSCYWV